MILKGGGLSTMATHILVLQLREIQAKHVPGTCRNRRNRKELKLSMQPSIC
jgi:hypothetical protein